MTKLIEAGVVQANPAVDATSATTDVWLTLQNRANGEGERPSEVARARGL